MSVILDMRKAISYFSFNEIVFGMDLNYRKTGSYQTILLKCAIKSIIRLSGVKLSNSKPYETIIRHTIFL
jgi:hypothetical protein